MVFDGNKLAQKILDEIKAKTSAWPKKPSLAVVSFGDKSANSSYIVQKKKTAELLGFGFKHYHCSETHSGRAREYLNKIAGLENISAVVVQLPLPAKINLSILNVISLKKDPDLLSDRAAGRFFNNRSPVDPPTAAAILKILDENGVGMAGKRVVIFGYGKLVGRFLVPLLLKRGAAVSVIEKDSPRALVLELARASDIIISAVGEANLVTADMVKPGAAVIDAGFSLIDGRITGDVEFDSVCRKASLVTPVPGGVGPVSVALLFRNIAELFRKQK